VRKLDRKTFLFALVYPCPKGSAGDPNSIALEAPTKEVSPYKETRGVSPYIDTSLRVHRFTAGPL